MPRFVTRIEDAGAEGFDLVVVEHESDPAGRYLCSFTAEMEAIISCSMLGSVFATDMDEAAEEFRRRYGQAGIESVH